MQSPTEVPPREKEWTHRPDALAVLVGSEGHGQEPEKILSGHAGSRRPFAGKGEHEPHERIDEHDRPRRLRRRLAQQTLIGREVTVGPSGGKAQEQLSRGDVIRL